jgi:hypothetical protein
MFVCFAARMVHLMLYAQLLERALVHGGSSLETNGSVVTNAVFFSQQLELWSTQQDELCPKYMAAAAAAYASDKVVFQQQELDKQWIDFKKE